MSADSYYNDNSGNQQYGQQNPPPYGQRHQNQGYQAGDEQTGERGFMGAIAGGAAGAYGGAKFGGNATGHTKTSGLVGAIAGAIAGSKLQDGVHDWREDRHDRKEEEEERRRREDEDRRRRDEDRYHDRRDDRYDDRRHDDHSYSGSRGGHYAGAFSSSSRDLRLDEDGGDWNLRASCSRGDGSYQSSTISLNRILGNNNGSFQWSSGSGGGGGGAQTVTVQGGDTLRAIAGRFGCNFEEIARINNINNPDMIYPGQTLQIPGGGGSSSGSGNFGGSARDVRLRDGSRLEASLRRLDGGWNDTSINLDERISNDNGTLRFI